MNDAAVEAVHARIQAMNGSHRPFALPILRAIDRLGGSAKKKDVVNELRRMIGDKLRPGVFDHLHKKGRFGWARLELKYLDLITGEVGTWALTDLGKRYVDAQAAVEIALPDIQPAASEESSSAKATEVITVPVTSFHGYEIPVLEALAAGKSTTKEILEEVLARLDRLLLKGDFGTIPSGATVWRFRTNWTLSNLGKAGETENVQTGIWRITDAGRQRLERERGSWTVQEFQGSSTATIVVGDAPPSSTASEPKEDLSSGQRWAKLKKMFRPELVDALHARLRPDLGPTPARGGFPRNVILYGPPGTGKTHVAKQVARALTGDDEGGNDGRFRIVQFHPSYAYEDFIQGLRPDLKKTELRYGLERGPFLRIAEDAQADPENFFVLIIDEINRGDPARIFGELLYALEYRDEAVMLPLGGELVVPSNLVVIGTMNSVDRSVALVDYALRRRFGFVRVDPDPEVLERAHGDAFLGQVGPVLLERFNEWLSSRLGREHVLGHSFFLSSSLDAADPTTLDRVWDLDVHPLMEEYFFGDADGVKDAHTRWAALLAEAIAEAKELAEDPG